MEKINIVLPKQLKDEFYAYINRASREKPDDVIKRTRAYEIYENVVKEVIKNEHD